MFTYYEETYFYEKSQKYCNADRWLINTQLSKLESVIQEISTNGRIVVKRAYGNWRKGSLKNWENELKRLAIKAEQQFDYVAGKNATDMALVIDTLDLLHSGIYDALSLSQVTVTTHLSRSNFVNPESSLWESVRKRRQSLSAMPVMNLSILKT